LVYAERPRDGLEAAKLFQAEIHGLNVNILLVGGLGLALLAIG
jgi:hypothetical protein